MPFFPLLAPFDGTYNVRLSRNSLFKNFTAQKRFNFLTDTQRGWEEVIRC